jgi:hypothetical protein
MFRESRGREAFGFFVVVIDAVCTTTAHGIVLLEANRI